MTGPRSTSIMILGGPNAGKSNYIGALWMQLRRNRGDFRIPDEPANIDYVERIVRHLRQGHYPPRTEPDEGDATFIAPISRAAEPKKAVAQLTVPDMVGEVWKAASKDREIDPAWVEQIRNSEAALLFVRFGSKDNVDMIDWISNAHLMTMEGAADNNASDQPPTQLFLCDLLNLLEEYLGVGTAAERPRVGIMVAAWDSVGPAERTSGPKNFIKSDYPMLHGRIADRSRLDVRVFGVSATGFDLDVPEQRDAFLTAGPAEAGFAETEGNAVVKKGDLLMPLSWVLEGQTG